MFGPKKLIEPLKSADGDITHVTLRRPDAGSLRGLKLTDVLQMDVTTMQKLLPRISEPALLPDQVEALCPADLLILAGGVVGFFVTEEQMQDTDTRLQ